MEGLEGAKNAVKGLTSASGFLRRELSSMVNLRKSPELRFIPDDSIAYSADVARILDSLHLEEKDREEEQEEQEEDQR